jgi:hypothetical protein
MGIIGTTDVADIITIMDTYHGQHGISLSTIKDTIGFTDIITIKDITYIRVITNTYQEHRTHLTSHQGQAQVLTQITSIAVTTYHHKQG